MGHLLVVDNDDDILELLAVGLEDMGYTVQTARSGLEALRSMERALPDVLITDLIMPNISGDKLLKICRAIPEWEALKTIVISGVATEAPEVRNEVLCDIYVAKGPIAEMLKYLRDSLNQFEKVKHLNRSAVIGSDRIHGRHITRELLTFKREVDSILDLIADGICRIDGNGTIVWLNCAFSALLQQPEERLLGRSLADHVVTGDREKLSSFTGSEEISLVEVEVMRPSGRRLARVTKLQHTTGVEAFVTILWQDITDRLLSEEHYENVVESTQGLILTTDRAGHINYVSRSSVRFLGQQPDELIGRFPWDLLSQETRDEGKQRYHETLARFDGGQAFDTDAWEVSLTRADGENRIVEVRTAPFTDRAERIMGMQLTLVDITRRRHLENERQALLYEVQHRVRENLQLVASLAQISGPERLDTRIAAVGEVFDELYREQSFSRVLARPLLERVIDLALAETETGARTSVSYDITVEYVPMRTAVPLSLLVTEIVASLTAPSPAAPQPDPRLVVELNTEADKFVLVGTYYDAPALPDIDGCDDGNIISLLVDQLHGTCRFTESGSTVVCRVVFAADTLVP